MNKLIPKEDAEQVTIADWLDLKVGPYNWCHVPNGGARNLIVAKKLKAQGVKAGVPDVMVFMRSEDVLLCHFSGVAIEMKRRNMVPSDVKPAQKEWLKQLEVNGWLTYVAAGAGDAIKFLEKWGY